MSFVELRAAYELSAILMVEICQIDGMQYSWTSAKCSHTSDTTNERWPTLGIWQLPLKSMSHSILEPVTLSNVKGPRRRGMRWYTISWTPRTPKTTLCCQLESGLSCQEAFAGAALQSLVVFNFPTFQGLCQRLMKRKNLPPGQVSWRSCVGLNDKRSRWKGWPQVGWSRVVSSRGGNLVGRTWRTTCWATRNC